MKPQATGACAPPFWLVFCLSACALAAPPPLSSLPPARPAQGAESPDQTIRKALADFQSDDPAIRKRAILILGKYQAPPARQALLRALEDPAAAVRRNALVSMTEQNWFPESRRTEILHLLADPDVHIRRILSSALPSIVPMEWRFRPPGASQSAAVLSKSTAETLRKAFRDSDETVRRNMLEYAHFFPAMPDEETVRALLKDDNAEIRIKAIRIAADTLSPPAFVRACQPLLTSSNAAVRLRLVSELSGISHPSVFSPLQELSADGNPVIAGTAAAALLQLGGNAPIETVKRALQTAEVDADLKMRLVFAIRRKAVPGNAWDELLQHACESPLPRIRAAALRVRSSRLPLEKQRIEAISFLEDPAETVREAALSLLLQQGESLPFSTAKKLAHNPHPDVRSRLVSLSAALSKEKARELLLDLLLDENKQVRARAILQFGRRNLPGALNILKQSLRDSDPQIRRAAAGGLYYIGDAKAAALLREHLKNNPDPTIRNFLQKLQLQLRTPQRSRPRK